MKDEVKNIKEVVEKDYEQLSKFLLFLDLYFTREYVSYSWSSEGTITVTIKDFNVFISDIETVKKIAKSFGLKIDNISVSPSDEDYVVLWFDIKL
jgi:hypothetical protein